MGNESMSDLLQAVETQLSTMRKKLASRRSRVEYRDNIPLLEAEIGRLEEVKRTMLEARQQENNDAK